MKSTAVRGEYLISCGGGRGDGYCDHRGAAEQLLLGRASSNGSQYSPLLPVADGRTAPAVAGTIELEAAPNV